MSTQSILNLLRGKTTRRIRFTFPASGTDLTIDSRAFTRVATAIDGGEVGISFKDSGSASFAAQYISGKGSAEDPNLIETPPIKGRIEEGLLLHECVHCYYDLAKTSITAIDEEASAYVANALYFRMSGVKAPRWNADLHSAGGKVAGKLLSEYAKGAPSVPNVDATLWSALLTAITASTTYSSLTTSSVYTHDG
jgi:hypothetical protein